ncbi:23S rRNA (uracil(1939)-C(5))-methyltransferase RlmD [Paracandidimonas soli]|uniref:23S rRNA (uracil(1939)-C(5))-methyltransferase RlmD n=1 Tax=Paracandidimonas soli TaxID=1917182 RepID=A0A4R3VDA6_9BURK|nr:23S rRNA (uracil(1939)-C(5))-methyltransferase RlmD [Paracandidimonas soli]TCV01579.1 23S rRNA (uracil1939-C5)-methyltransferase [Paracandidimonas soli]
MSELYEIESLDLDARGIAVKDGKRVLVDSALPGERVMAHKVKLGTEYDKARLDRVVRRSAQRVEPPCPYFGVCGGCKMQHLEPAAQVAVKQRVLEEAFQEQGSLKIGHVLAPMHGPYWNYRYRARLSVRRVVKKGGMLVGFRERNGSYVTDMASCRILPVHVSDMLVPLRELIGGLSNPHRYPQIEVSVGDRTTALVLRHLEPLTEDDLSALRAFGETWNVSWWLQPKGPETVAPLDPARVEDLAYELPEYGLRMVYRPTDFTQVNPHINRMLIQRAIRLLEPGPQDRVADLFCGLGNFSLPLARVAGSVLGVEGSKALTERAMQGAVLHGLQDKAAFGMLNLFEVDAGWLRSLGYFDRMLIDPPREGAEAVSLALAELTPDERPKRIVYVSCNPVTLARDAAILVHRGKYRLRSAGVVNMFPHTGHVESMAVFE